MKKDLLKLASFVLAILLTALVFSCNNKDTLQPPSVIVGTNVLAGPKDGGTVVLAIIANTDWSVEVPKDVPWIAAAPLKGSASAFVTFSLLPNPALPREATVLVKNGTTVQNVKIQQSGLVKTYISMTELRAKGETTITQDLYVKGSLISDQVGGNATSLKNLYISDGTAGMCVRLVADASTMAVGTELEFQLNGAQLAKFNGLLQLNNFTNANMSVTGKTIVIPPKTITAAQFKTGNYESMYVAIPNVQVINADLSKTMVVGLSLIHISEPTRPY